VRFGEVAEAAKVPVSGARVLIIVLHFTCRVY
jgi:hypothetical protein